MQHQIDVRTFHQHRKLVICLSHKLLAVRESLGLTRQDLAELSGISLNTIHRIESGDVTYKVNEATARSLADALYLKTMEIFQPIELSHLGRPPHTGKAYVVNLTEHKLCPDCRTELPVIGLCSYCTPDQVPVLH